ncbi:MAG: UMP kinase [Clostridia bacterium]|nr:UMP kinase [Clostridia bacterium]
MKRILIKLSGEALANNSKENVFDPDFVDEVAAALATCAKEGYEIGVVVGAGNIWRGRQSGDMDRVAADRMGMLATVINSIYLKDAIERQGVPTSVMTAISVFPFAEPYSSDIAKKYLSEGRIVIFGAGTGMPFFSTDTTGAIRAAEIDADAMLMAKNVDYVYTDDPKKNPDAKKIEEIKASEVLAMNLKAIDATATAFCLSVGMPIRIFGLNTPADIIKAVKGESLGTIITAE